MGPKLSFTVKNGFVVIIIIIIIIIYFNFFKPSIVKVCHSSFISTKQLD